MIRTVKVGPHTYTVGTAPAPDLGHCDADNLKINVSPQQAPTQERATLLHELFHAIANRTGLDKSWGDAEEFYVTLLADEVFALLRANPKLVEFLTD